LFGDWVQECWFQHGYVENQVYSMETVQKLEGDQVGAGSCKDFVWSEVFVGNFLGRLIHMEELSLDKYVASDLEFWSWRLLGISRGLVSAWSFGNVLPEMLV